MKSFLSKTKYSIAIFCCIIFSSCYYDKAEVLYGASNADCNTLSAKFSTDINPIIQTNCTLSNCHGSNSPSGVNFYNYNQISLRTDAIYKRALFVKDMPPTGPLSIQDQNKLKCWIGAGAPNN
jgi:uncharacterized membrane protein